MTDYEMIKQMLERGPIPFTEDREVRRTIDQPDLLIYVENGDTKFDLKFTDGPYSSYRVGFRFRDDGSLLGIYACC